ncbi:tyrosine-type recombinase/integrase [Vreelandella indica]|uniref:tyrosine-type recombinase/integrase n=1 Tax=Vreelandella indica TaxID=3126500 RepID=UPI00300DE669
MPINSDKSVKALVPGDGQRKVRKSVLHKGLEGLVLEARVNRSSKGWIYRFSLSGRQQEMRLGSYPKMTLAEARTEHAKVAKLVAKGLDPRVHRSAEKAANQSAWTMNQAFEKWIDFYAQAPGKSGYLPKEKTVTQHRRRWRLYLEKPLGKMYVRDLSRRDAIEALQKVAAGNVKPAASGRGQGGRTEARHTLGVLRMMMAYAVDYEQVEESPVSSLTPAKVGTGSSVPRERHLILHELRQLWSALDQKLTEGRGLSPSVANAIRLLVLTGCRRAEVSGMRWSEVHGNIWTLPAPRTKSQRKHKVFLATLVMHILDEQKSISNSDYVFPSPRLQGRPIHEDSISTAVTRLQGRALKMQDSDAPLHSLEPFVAHDLRRTAATAWTDFLKAEPMLVEQMLDHAPPKLVATYNKAGRWEEQVDVWSRWAQFVADQIATAPGEKAIT